MNDYYPFIMMALLIAVIILWVCVRSIFKKWQNTRNDELSAKLENIFLEALREKSKQMKSDNPPSDDPPDAPLVPDDKPKNPTLSGSAAKKFPPEDE